MTEAELKATEAAALAKKPAGGKILVAVATKGGGRERTFRPREGVRDLRAIGRRREIGRPTQVDLYCQDGAGDEDRLAKVIRAIQDCAAVLVAKIGLPSKEKLAKAGIEAVDTCAYEFIEPSAIAYHKDYLAKVERGGDPKSLADWRQEALVSG
jgi:nitrogen fixation protein NifB